MKKTFLIRVYKIATLCLLVGILTVFQTAKADKSPVRFNGSLLNHTQANQIKNPKGSNQLSKPKANPIKTIETNKLVNLPILPSQSRLILQRKIQWAINKEELANVTPLNRVLEVTASAAKSLTEPDSHKVVEEFGQNMSLKTTGETTVKGKTWYLVKDHGKGTWISNEEVRLLPRPSVLLNAPLVKQLPELPRGCEVTSLTMLIDQAGKRANKMVLAKQIKKVPFFSNGFKGNPYDGFVGDIYSFEDDGLGVYHGPIEALAKDYLGDRAVDLTGKGWPSIEKQLNQGHAVWVITNATFSPLPNWSFENWETKEGTIKVTYKEHSVLITGYGPGSIYINDPLTGIKNLELDKNSFIQAWKQMGSQAVSYN